MTLRSNACLSADMAEAKMPPKGASLTRQPLVAHYGQMGDKTCLKR